jgi:hypothetical protein
MSRLSAEVGARATPKNATATTSPTFDARSARQKDEGSRYFYTTPDRGIAASLQDLTRLFTSKPACEAWSKGIAGV